MKDTSFLLALLIASVVVNLILLTHLRVVTADHSWKVGSQGAWHWKLRLLSLVARVYPPDVVHFDIDHLKQLNAALGEERVNELLQIALRSSDAYRTQSGDELAAIVWRRDGREVAQKIFDRLASLPLTVDERALVSSITATFVVVKRARRLKAALPQAVKVREQRKSQGLRGSIYVVEE